MTDLTKLTAKDLHDMLSTGLTSWTPPLYAVMREFVRRAEGYALACGDRDSARDEVAEMKELRDAAKSDHKEACRILRNYQTLAEERGREIGALTRERDELHRRAQANDGLRATLSNWCVQFGAALCPTAGSADSFGDGMRAAKEQVSRILAAAPAAPAAQPTPAAPATDVHCDLRPGECDEPDEGVCDGERQARDFMAMELTDEAKRKARGWWIPELLSTIDCLRAERLAFLRRAELAESKLAQDTPTPAAPVTDAEIEAAITALTVDARREADALRVNPEASGTATEKRANRQVQLRALIARRVASAGAAPVDSERASADRYESHLFHTDDGMPSSRCRVCGVVYKEAGFVPCKPAPVDSEREAAIEAWRTRNTTCNHVSAPLGGGYIVPDAEIDEAVRLMRSAPPPPAGDQDAKLRELRARLLSTAASLPNRQMGHSDEDFDRGYVEACENWAQEIDRLLAAPAAPAGDQDAKLRELLVWVRQFATDPRDVEAKIESMLAAPAASKGGV